MLGRLFRQSSKLGRTSMAGHQSLKVRHITSRSSILSKTPSFKSTSSPSPFTRHMGPLSQSVRNLNLHEHQSMDLFQKYGVDTPKYVVATSPSEAEKKAVELPGPDYVIKAQVLAGGRGKGHFKSGFEGGVHFANSTLELESLASKMIGQELVTKQTGEAGKPCNAVLITERLYLRRETYLSILLDRQSAGPCIIASSAGGMNIEEVAELYPEKIIREPIDIKDGIQDYQIDRIHAALGFGKDKREEVSKVVNGLYNLFMENDSTLVEINPLAETHDGRVLCIDAKLNFDDNAVFRNKELHALRDRSQEDVREIEAAKFDLNYIGLDGNIGCLVNGAGLAMATLDIVKLHGGSPANFLDVGGGATSSQVQEAFRLLQEDEKVRCILVNIFGGIMKCDVIALGIIKAAQATGLSKPLVVRLAGTNVKEAHDLIEESGLRMLTAGDLDEAAQKAVRIVDIQKMASDADLQISFELPI